MTKRTIGVTIIVKLMAISERGKLMRNYLRETVIIPYSWFRLNRIDNVTIDDIDVLSMLIFFSYDVGYKLEDAGSLLRKTYNMNDRQIRYRLDKLKGINVIQWTYDRKSGEYNVSIDMNKLTELLRKYAYNNASDVDEILYEETVGIYGSQNRKNNQRDKEKITVR